VKYAHFFEDDENVYIMLEYCKNGTMEKLLKRGGYLPEVECRYFMKQLVEAFEYT
jgi:polo-like kinase 1